MANISSLACDTLSRCVSNLALSALPATAAVARLWHAASTQSFDHYLRWRLPVVSHEIEFGRVSESGSPALSKGSGCGRFTTSGDVVVLMADPATHAVCTFAVSSNANYEISEELQRRQWVYDNISVQKWAAIGHCEGSVAFFPTLEHASGKISDACVVAPTSNQSILSCGDQVLFVNRCLWWQAESILAHLLHLPDGGWLTIELSPLRDAMACLLDPYDFTMKQAVSATDNFFLFQADLSGRDARAGVTGKIIGSIRLPSAHGGAHHVGEVECVMASTAFARKWETGAIAQMSLGNETYDGDKLILYGTWNLSGLAVCVLDAGSGKLHEVQLQPPPHDGMSMLSLSQGGLQAFAVCSGLACGCGPLLREFKATPVLLWDLETGIMITELMSAHSPLAQTLRTSKATEAPRKLHGTEFRFGVGQRVESRMDSAWVPGRIVALNYREDDWPRGQYAPYQVELVSGDLIYAPRDTCEVIRAADYFCTTDVEVQLDMKPDSHALLMGLWERRQPHGMLHVLRAGAL